MTMFDTLRHAILKRQQIAFRYVSSTGEVSNRKVTPLRLIFKGRAWYVICVKKPNQQKLFRLSRMLEVSIAGDSDIDDIATRGNGLFGQSDRFGFAFFSSGSVSSI